MYDTIIKNGIIIDGTGNPRRRQDIGITGGKISTMGNLKNAQAKRVIDASGLVVCPGLIDVHSHSDVTVPLNPRFDSTIRQGVTTEVVGNCGNSAAPFAAGAGSGFGTFGDTAPVGQKTLAQHMQHLEESGFSANMAWLVGHNTIRSLAGVTGDSPTEAQYLEMERLLCQTFEDGAIGFSSGLEFEPGRTCKPEELLRLTAIVKEYDGMYTSHIRNRDAGVLEALDEFLHAVETHGLRAQVSHLNIRHNTHAPQNAFQKCVAKLQAARDKGLEVLTDMTPLNYGIGMMSGILPKWLTAASPDKLREMLLDPDTRARLRTDCDRYWRFITNGEWERVRMQNNPTYPEINGLSFPEIAKLWSKDPWDCYFDILAGAAPDINSVILVSYLFTDEHLRETIANPLYMLVMDGYSSSATGEVAKYTQFPLHYIGMTYFLTHHVRTMNTLSLEEAIRKMTSMPATHFRLGKRGLLAEGYEADICVFDYERLESPFDLQNPAQYAKGMAYVLVNGTFVLDGGEHTGAMPGRIIRG